LSPLGKTGGKIGTAQRIPIIEALHEIALSLRDGDRLGLVGHNGAGKSTLLRIMAGIYEPTWGTARISGTVAPVFDLGVGMDPEISGYENIIIRGLFLGMTRKQMQARVGDIAEFTELGDYLSMPLRTYSTGMRVRLALGVVTSIDPEILLLDEGIGAVDTSFLDKARDRLHDLVRRSGILVFASHSNDLLVEQHRDLVGGRPAPRAGHSQGCDRPLQRAPARRCGRSHRPSERAASLMLERTAVTARRTRWWAGPTTTAARQTQSRNHAHDFRRD